MDFTNVRFGRLLAKRIDQSKEGKKGAPFWFCVCDCGSIRSVNYSNLASGMTKSCGCLAKEMTSERSTIHGMYGTGTYNSWWAMTQRCNYKKHIEYQRYGARGIRVCEGWREFASFLEDMGERPEGTSIDRIDPDGDYCPENCRWADKKTQSYNRRTTRKMTVNGITKPVPQWADETGVKASVIRRRLDRGWEPERAICA
jgi:hypothetical protein